MKSPQKQVRRLALAALLAGCVICAPAASAQLLPGISDRLDDAIGDRVNNSVSDRLNRLPRTLETLPDRLPDRSALRDRLDDVISSQAVGNTLRETRELLGERVDGVRSGIAHSRSMRPIDVDRFDGWPAIRNEWVILLPATETTDLSALQVTVLERAELRSVAQTLYVVSFPDEADVRSQLEDSIRALNGEVLERNHVFRRASGEDLPEVGAAPSSASDAFVPGEYQLGMIDTDIEETHPALSTIQLREADFVSHGDLRPTGHGTAIASILAGEATAGAPRGLLAASVFFLADDGTTGATTASLVQAMDWLVSEGARVINFSLTGPPNAVLERFITDIQAQGVVLVAAVGNEGPASGPLYPAAYDGVIGVTAVDAEGRLYRWANRGPFVDVAALGVNVDVALPGGGMTIDSGTSFAAPIVSAFLAGWQQDTAEDEPAENRLIRALGWSPDQAKDEATGYGVFRAAASGG